MVHESNLTICFFWIGNDINIPTLFVRSIRLIMGNDVNIVQLTNKLTKAVSGITSIKRLKLSEKIMIARLEAYSEYQNETDYTFFCDADCLLINNLSFPNNISQNIILSPRKQDLKMNYNYPEYYEEFVGKRANEVMPFLFCAIGTVGNQQLFFRDLLKICLGLPARFHRWYGDQYALFLTSKDKFSNFELFDPDIYLHEMKKPLIPDYLNQIMKKGVQILHFKGYHSKIHMEQSLLILEKFHEVS